MSVAPAPIPKPRIIYPDGDGAPIAENTIQYEWITKIVGGPRAMFANDPNGSAAGGEVSRAP